MNLERQIRDQFEVTARQCACFSILNHQTKEVTEEIERFRDKVPDNLRQENEELSKVVSEGNSNSQRSILNIFH